MISGVAMVKGGLAVPWAIMMSLLVYAGSAQLAALPLIVAGAPLWVIVATGLITNLRFVIYSAALRPYFADLPLAQARRAGLLHDRFHVHAFHALGAGRHAARAHRDAWFAGVCANNWITWQLSAITGIIGASYVPTRLGPGIHRHAGAGGAGGPEPECAARHRRRGGRGGGRAHRLSACRSSSGCSAAPSPASLAATLTDCWQQRAPPPRAGGRMSDPVAGWALAVVIIGLALSTFVTRTSFLLAGAKLRLGHRVEVALRYAPVCTLAAIIVPDILIHPPGARARPVAAQSAAHRRAGRGTVALLVAQSSSGAWGSGMAAYTLARLYL